MADAPADGDQVATDVAQPRIVSSSLAGLRVLGMLGIEAHRGRRAQPGRADRPALGGRDGRARSWWTWPPNAGRAMADASEGGGAMAGIAAGPEVVEALLREVAGTMARRS